MAHFFIIVGAVRRARGAYFFFSRSQYHTPAAELSENANDPASLSAPGDLEASEELGAE